ncbi:hypothetical protein K458DRAFT_323692 [Lentithecium fluviatile CBS 122367]|uniref:Dipeptidase n=1 Tax=Lentithecium fluviatile CBS 122367 TaxID=1168545 RepID=A0A6G1ICR2_9PLEO|nr:hypothetical protein K458DRAFT_323692 [Lentithecium fluviatile CBS 122367]
MSSSQSLKSPSNRLKEQGNASFTDTPVASPDLTPARESALILHPNSQTSGFFARWRRSFIAAGLAALLSPLTFLWPGEAPINPTDYTERTRRVLKITPLIDGHNDLPWQLRVELHNRIYDNGFDATTRLLGHTDLTRMRQGQVGGQFWSVYVDCDVNQQHFEDPSWIIRDTLDQIDVTKRFIQEHPALLQFCETPACIRAAFKSGRIASMIGIEGGHQVGGSIASIRQMYELGARYITLTHNCDNAFGTAASTVRAGGADEGLFPLGYEAVKEMNRLGMLVDLSHVSHQMMRDVLSVTQAPVIFSHSGAYSVTKHNRNVPDDVLRSVKKNGGVVMAVFEGMFLNMANPGASTIHDVVDHILHIAHICGWECVGAGSDFSGGPHMPIGLEDVSKFPHLVQALMERGATDEQIRMFAGENILRVWEEVEQRAKEMQAGGMKPVEKEYEWRKWHLAERDDPCNILRKSQV